MLEPDPYVACFEIDGRREYVTIDRFDVEAYRCGLSAGDRISLIADLPIMDAEGNPTGEVMSRDDVHTVLKGSSEDPTTLWLRKPDGELHTWDDDPSIWDDFRRIEV